MRPPRAGPAAALRIAALAPFLALAPACAPASRGEPAPDSANPPAQHASGQEDDTTAIRRLEREARALATATGCSSADQCAAAPVGSRPCGGPRDFIVYCRLTTDSARLYRTLDELARRERAWNATQGLVSTCELRLPPEPVLSGGACRAP